MADITARRADTDRQQGVIIPLDLDAVQVYEGALLAINSSGYVTNASDTASEVIAGVAEESVDNSGGSAGDKQVKVNRKGVYSFTAGFAAAQSNVGDLAYASDNQTVDLAANLTNDVVVGRIVEVVSSSKVRVDIEDRVA